MGKRASGREQRPEVGLLAGGPLKSGRRERMMRKMLAGLVAGLILGTALGASAQRARGYSGADLLAKDAEFQDGFVAGAVDGFSRAREIIATLNKGNASGPFSLQMLDYYLACLNRHAETPTALRQWAVGQWTRDDRKAVDTAATIMIGSGCLHN